MEISWVDSLPQFGVGGVLVAIIVYVLRSNHQDRAQYSELRERADAQHDEDIADLRQQIAELRGWHEAERRARWKAEDEAAYFRRLAGLSDDDGEPTAGGGIHPPREPT